jgi:hypothetical protein
MKLHYVILMRDNQVNDDNVPESGRKQDACLREVYLNFNLNLS